MTTHTIGPSTGFYNSLSSWIAGCPPDITAAGTSDVWIGDQIETLTGSSGSMCNLSGITTDSTHYIRCTAHAGQSIVDQIAGGGTLSGYDTSGSAVGITSSASYSSIFLLNGVAHFRIDRLQLKATTNTTSILGVVTVPTTFFMDQCVLETQHPTLGVGLMYSPNMIMRQCLVVQRGGSRAAIIQLNAGAQAYGCTFVVPSGTAAASAAWVGLYGGPTLKNCAVYGCTALNSGGGAPTVTTCYTDITGNPSGFTTAAYNNTQFVNITNDWRITSSSAFKDAGTVDSTNCAVDIANVTRANGTTTGSNPDAGCWEYVAAGGPSSLPLQSRFVKQAINRSYTY